MANGSTEQSPLLQRQSQDEDSRQVFMHLPSRWSRSLSPFAYLCAIQVVDFTKSDEENPRNWSRRRKLVNVAIVSLMARLLPESI